MISETAEFFKYVTDRTYFAPLEYNGVSDIAVFTPQKRGTARELATMYNQCYIISKQGFLKAAAIISKDSLLKDHGIKMTSLGARSSEFAILQSDYVMAIKKLAHHFGKRVVHKEIRTELLGSKQAVKILVEEISLLDLIFIEDEMSDCRYTIRAEDSAIIIYQATTLMGGSFGFQIAKAFWQRTLQPDEQLRQNLQQILRNNPRLLASAERYLVRQCED